MSSESPTASGNSRYPGWTLALVSVALFMAALDNLVVGIALPSIRADLGGTLESLEWTVNAYTLAFAVLLISGAALGDRYGRKLMFMVGVGIFTGASVLTALAPSYELLIAGRAIQGVGAAILLPLTLTLVSEAVPPEKRGMALGVWSGVMGLGIALGPFVGGAVVQGLAWQWIFWINVPIGLVIIPLSIKYLTESRGPDKSLDLPGLGLISVSLLAITFAVIESQSLGWGSATVIALIATGVTFMGAFIAWELRTKAPMLPMGLFRSRAFSAVNVAGFLMFLGVFGSIFLTSQFFQTAQGYGPLKAGLLTLPWTAVPMFIAPVAGILSDKYGDRPLLVGGLGLSAISIYWMSQVMTPDVAFSSLIAPFVIAGIGMSFTFPSLANAVLHSVKPEMAGKASGAHNALREFGTALGVAVLASVFAAAGSYASPQAFNDGMVAALPIGAACLLAAAIAAMFIPGKVKQFAPATEPEAVAAPEERLVPAGSAAH